MPNSHAHSVIHGGDLGSLCTISLSFEEVEVSHMSGQPSSCDQLTVQILDTKAQVSVLGWEYLVHVVLHHCWKS